MVNSLLEIGLAHWDITHSEWCVLLSKKLIQVLIELYCNTKEGNDLKDFSIYCNTSSKQKSWCEWLSGSFFIFWMFHHHCKTPPSQWVIHHLTSGMKFRLMYCISSSKDNRVTFCISYTQTVRPFSIKAYCEFDFSMSSGIALVVKASCINLSDS